MKLSFASKRCALGILPGIAYALYPSTTAENPIQGLTWGSGNTATLEFCETSGGFAYPLPGEMDCVPQKPGPLIVLSPGSTYTLYLKNLSSKSTNIHTHGLHQVGDGDGDNIFREALPGECLQYTWAIPSGHSGGTHWCHPHFRGQTQAQTGGAHGMIIVEELSNGPNNWALVSANWKLLQIYGGNPVLGKGVSNEVINMESDRWYPLRVSVITLDEKMDSISVTGCSVYKVQSDGVWHDPTKSLTAYSTQPFQVTGVSRADFAIKCTADSEIMYGNYAAAAIQIGDDGCRGQASSGNDEDDLGLAPSRPYHLRGLLPSSLGTMLAGWDSIQLTGANSNGFQWPTSPEGSIVHGDVYEWTISGSSAHPFHLHLYHMQVVSGCDSAFEQVSSSGGCTVRFKVVDFGQRMVMHCHLLQHEDNGVITYITVNGASQENTVDAPSTATCGGRRALKGKSDPPPSPPGRKLQKEKTATTASPTISPKPGGGCPTAGGSALTTSPSTSSSHGPIISPVSPTNPQSMAPSSTSPTPGPTATKPTGPTCADVGEGCRNNASYCDGLTCTSGNPKKCEPDRRNLRFLARE